MLYTLILFLVLAAAATNWIPEGWGRSNVGLVIGVAGALLSYGIIRGFIEGVIYRKTERALSIRNERIEALEKLVASP